MESIVKRSLSSLAIIMMLFTLVMPVMVKATDAAAYAISDMKLNTVIYFKGQTYSPINYKCTEKYAKENYEEEMAGIVWKINKKQDSLVVQLSNGKFRTIKVEQVLKIRDEKFLNIELSNLEELKNGELKLNIKILGEKNQIDLSNNGVVRLDTDGGLVLGFENGTSKLTINRKDAEPIEMFIIKDASGNVTLDIEEKYMSAGVKATLLEKIRAGGDVALAIQDGVIVVAGNAAVTDPNEEHTYVGADGALYYDTQNPDGDIMADVKVDIADNTVIEKTGLDTRIVKTIKSLIARLRAR